MSLKLKTLFICFYFPPFNRVGGRRWAKYLKYFANDQEDFYVLAGDYKTKSNWDNDIIGYENRITRIPVIIKYPYHKRKLPENFIQKIGWKLSYLFWDLKDKYYKGNFWDDTVGYEEKFYNEAVRLIEKHGIQQILITLGPFKISTILLELKKKFPDLKIVIDYRDRLEDSFTNLSESKIAEEQALQKKVLEKADLVLSPYNYMQKYYSEKFNISSFLLPHCYDEYDFTELKFNANREKEEKELKFVYGGSLYLGLDEELKSFFLLQKRISAMGFKPITNLYVPQKGYEDIIVKSETNTNLLPVLPLKSYYNEILNSDFALVFRPKWSNDNFSSKFFELIRLGKPILYVGEESEVSRFIENNNLGFVLSKLNNEDAINQMLSKVESGQIPDKHYVVEKHSFEKSALDLIKILNESIK